MKMADEEEGTNTAVALQQFNMVLPAEIQKAIAEVGRFWL